MKKLLFLLILLPGIFFTTTVKAQVFTGCSGAVDLNINPSFSTTGYSTYDPSISYGCVSPSQYFVYGYFDVCTPGSLTLYTFLNTSAYDVDIVVWGPFSSVTNICSNLTAGNIAGCANTLNYQDTVALGNVNAGDIYMVSVACDTNIFLPQIAFVGSAAINSSCSVSMNANCYPVSGIEDFCLATVDSATQKYKLTWEKHPPNAVSYFEIRKYGLNQQFNLIDTVNYSSLSEYIDMSSNPSVMGAVYQLATRDTCGGGWSSGGEIHPVFCQASVSTSNSVNVSWTPYYSTTSIPAYYVIYRGATPTTMSPIDSIPNNMTMYTDVNPLSGTSYYKIGVALNGTCVPSHVLFATVQSFSNNSAVSIVGMNEHANPLGIALFPNPSNGTVNLQGLDETSTLIVTDMTGRIVHSGTLQPAPLQQLDLSMLEKGVYQLLFSNENGSSAETLVLVK